MGDSFVWGSPYITLNHMWWRQLGQILEPNAIEVIALGRPGASTHDQLQWAKYFVPKYQPDLIIWGYVTNDADEGLVRQIDTSKQSIPKFDRFRMAAKSIWPRMIAKFDGLRSNKLATMYTGAQYGYEYSEWELKLVEPENLALYSSTVREIRTFLDETNIASFMMTLPNFPSTKTFDPRFTPIIKTWRDAGIAAYDTSPEFVRRYGETPLSGSETLKWGINPADGHPGPRSCRFLAEQAAEIVRRDFPQIVGDSEPQQVQPVIDDWLPNLDLDSEPRLESDGKWKMTYPADESRWPTMPIGTPTPLIAFKTPIPVSSIELGGPSLKSAQLWATFLDATEHYDDGVLYELGEKSGTSIRWKLPPELSSRPISVIRFRTTFSNPNRELEWSFSSNGKVAE